MLLCTRALTLDDQHITSKDPITEAAIDPRVFEEKYGKGQLVQYYQNGDSCHASWTDLDSLVEAVKFVREFVKTEPLAEFINGSFRSLL